MSPAGRYITGGLGLGAGTKAAHRGTAGDAAGPSAPTTTATIATTTTTTIITLTTTSAVTTTGGG